MKTTLLAGLLLAALSAVSVHAQDSSAPASSDAAGSDAASSDAASNGGWSGSGEFGFASATGNSRSQNVNAKLGLSQENEQWKNTFFFDALRSKSQTKVVDAAGNTINEFNTTADRYDGGASIGYKLDPRSYIVGATRYDHDQFGANLWQGVVSLGYGYIAIKDDRNELSFEIGPGYKRYRPADVVTVVGSTLVRQQQTVRGEVVARGLVNYKHKLTDNTSLEDTFLMEAGSRNTYLQNDAGLAVSMTSKLALKVGFQVRHNSNVLPSVRKSDTLTTTNLVYKF
jgi:putative salt-induced outer membrane protein